jgi:hypothetical protein
MAIAISLIMSGLFCVALSKNPLPKKAANDETIEQRS